MCNVRGRLRGRRERFTTTRFILRIPIRVWALKAPPTVVANCRELVAYWKIFVSVPLSHGRAFVEFKVEEMPLHPSLFVSLLKPLQLLAVVGCHGVGDRQVVLLPWPWLMAEMRSMSYIL